MCIQRATNERLGFQWNYRNETLNDLDGRCHALRTRFRTVELRGESRFPRTADQEICYHRYVRLVHINGESQQAVQSTWPGRVVLQKFFDLRGEDPRLNFMRWSGRYTARFVHSEKHRPKEFRGRRDRVARNTCHPEKVRFVSTVCLYTYVCNSFNIGAYREREREREHRRWLLFNSVWKQYAPPLIDRR